MCERGVSRLEVWNYIGLQYTVGAPASPRDSFRLFRVAIACNLARSKWYSTRYVAYADRSERCSTRFVSLYRHPRHHSPSSCFLARRRVVACAVCLSASVRDALRSDLTLRTRLTARTALRGAARAQRAPRTAVATSTKISNLKLAKFSHLGHRSRAPRGVTRFSVRDREFAITGRSSGRITGDTEAIAKSHRSTTTRPFVPIANAKPT